ncbi:hypothetical protein JXA27_07030 [Aerococcaceae bacterium zg-B36]|uniref:hypothetical protein n=1 Tax=Aerococcaceae bacterium zg-252 TaxID=2796928 RepID=UPI001BD892CC|nr:hypothetical protein [Aerococcaceae bacterium zg-B36]
MSDKQFTSIFEEREERLMRWVSFWRKNPHRFVSDYLGINLHFFQKILIYMMNIHPYFVYIASRGQNKKEYLNLLAWTV